MHAKTWMIIGKKHLHVCWGGKTWAQTLHQVGWRRWCGHSQSETSAHTGEIWHPRVPQTCSCHLRNNNMKHYWHHLPTHINDLQNSLHSLAAWMTNGICPSVCVWTQRTVYILTSHKYTWTHSVTDNARIQPVQNVSDNTQINSVFILPEWRQILNTFTDLFQCTWANFHIYSLSPWTKPANILFVSVRKKTKLTHVLCSQKGLCHSAPVAVLACPIERLASSHCPLSRCEEHCHLHWPAHIFVSISQTATNKTTSNVVAYNYSHQEK